MLEDLINKEVICEHYEIIHFMYPNFQLARDKFDIQYYINTSQPFIYIGSSIYKTFIKTSSVPYIIVSTTGEYNLNDRNTLINLALKKHGKKLSDEYNVLKKLSDKDFMYNWKLLWVIGELSTSTINTYESFNFFCRNLNCPYLIIKNYIKNISPTTVNVFQEILIDFISDAMKEKITNNVKYNELLKKFKTNYGKNVSSAIQKFLETPHPIPYFNTMEFLKNILKK